MKKWTESLRLTFARQETTFRDTNHWTKQNTTNAFRLHFLRTVAMALKWSENTSSITRECIVFFFKSSIFKSINKSKMYLSSTGEEWLTSTSWWNIWKITKLSTLDWRTELHLFHDNRYVMQCVLTNVEFVNHLSLVHHWFRIHKIAIKLLLHKCECEFVATIYNAFFPQKNWIAK